MDIVSRRPVELDPSVDSLHAHPHSDDPWWNESAWFGFSIPERAINGFFYFWHRTNMDLVAAGVAVWDEAGAHRDDCLHYHWFHFNPSPEGADMFDFSLSNGMSASLVEPLSAYQLNYESPACSLDLLFKGASPAFDVSFGNDPQGMGSVDFGNFHYEQFGHVTGTLVIDGEEMAVDGHHVRDRSWGVRRPFLPNMRGGLDMCWISEDLAFCTTMVTPEQPTLEPTADALAYGMLLVDGVMSRPTAGERRVTERGPDGRPLTVEVELEADDGRRIEATGRTRNCLKYDDLWFVHWALVEWDVDGQQGWGEMQDMIPVDALRRHQRRNLTQGGERT